MFVLGLALLFLSCSTAPSSRDPAGSAAAGSTLTASATLMERQAQVIDPLYTASGYANIEALKAAIDKKGGTYKTAYEILDKGEFSVVMAAPDTVRDALIENGFQNTHETKTSGGVENTSLRDGAEALLLGLNREQYEKIPASAKPKYAYLAPRAGTASEKLASSRAVWSYGADRWTLKLDHFKNRMSLFAGDSLNAVVPYLGFEGEDLGRAEETKTWHLRYIPWSRRQILAPMLGEGLAPTKRDSKTHQTLGNTLGLRTESFTMTEKLAQSYHLLGGMTTTCGAQPAADNHWDDTVPITFLACTDFEFKVPGFTDYAKGRTHSMDYIEAHIWGPITIDDVESVTFNNSAPSAEVLAKLKAKGITVRDVRNACQKEKQGACMTKSKCLKIGMGEKSDSDLKEWHQRFSHSGANIDRLFGNKKLSWSKDGCEDSAPVGCCF
jgi:hypothetical protein